MEVFKSILLLTALCLWAGCSPPTYQKETVSVSGTVTLDGQPLEQGEVYFKSDATGEIDVLPVRQGAFQGQAAPGERRVEIFSWRESEVVPMPGMEPQKTRENTLPARYNLESALKAQVKPEGGNDFKFEMTSQ